MDPSARIGTTLRGKWRLDRVLGTGGFATVYAATHRAGKRVAIKVLHPALNASAEVRRRFLKEAYAANAVDHPGVVGVSDDDVTEDGAAFLVMDLLDGETVEARRKGSGGRLEASTVLDIADQTLAALAAAHAKGVVHRDLKPENLFVTTEDRVKILDFGIARFREPGEEGTATQTGLTMGSPAFMAPEQARGRWAEVDARTDVYSLGATMFMLLSGQLVHGKGNMNETLIAAATRPAAPLATVAPHVPPPVAAIVDRAVAFEKEARWPDVQTMRAAVLAAREAVGSAVSTLPLAYAPPLTTLASPLTAGAKPLTATPTLATLPIAEGRPSTPSSTGPVTTSSPVVSAPVTGPTAVLVAPAVPAPPPRGRSRTAPLAVGLLGVAACAVVATTLWGVSRPSVPAGGTEPITIPMPPAPDPSTAPDPTGGILSVDIPSAPPSSAAPAVSSVVTSPTAAPDSPAPTGKPATASGPPAPKQATTTAAPQGASTSKAATATTAKGTSTLLKKRK